MISTLPTVKIKNILKVNSGVEEENYYVNTLLSGD